MYAPEPGTLPYENILLMCELRKRIEIFSSANTDIAKRRPS